MANSWPISHRQQQLCARQREVGPFKSNKQSATLRFAHRVMKDISSLKKKKKKEKMKKKKKLAIWPRMTLFEGSPSWTDFLNIPRVINPLLGRDGWLEGFLLVFFFSYIYLFLRLLKNDLHSL